MAQMGSYAITTWLPQDECSRSSISSATALSCAKMTSSVSFASRSSSVSPTHTITERPWKRACATFLPTVVLSSLSNVRRSLWPMITHGTSKSSSISALTSPVNAPVSES